jgi:hypothetical protein
LKVKLELDEPYFLKELFGRQLGKISDTLKALEDGSVDSLKNGVRTACGRSIKKMKKRNN